MPSAALPILYRGYLQPPSALAAPNLPEVAGMHLGTILLDIALDAVYPGLDREARTMVSAEVALRPFHWLCAGPSLTWLGSLS